MEWIYIQNWDMNQIVGCKVTIMRQSHIVGYKIAITRYKDTL